MVREVPELRIVEPELWERVQAGSPRSGPRSSGDRDQRADPAPLLGAAAARAPADRQGRVRGCGKPFAAVGRDYLACRVAPADGPCANRARVRRDQVEAQVLEALGTRLMRPELVAEFVAEFTAEWNRLRGRGGGRLARSAARARGGAAQARRTGRGDRRRAAGARGCRTGWTSWKAAGAALEAEAGRLEAAPALPRLHPEPVRGLPRAGGAAARRARQHGDGPEVLEAARALMERVEVHPPAGPAAARDWS